MKRMSPWIFVVSKDTKAQKFIKKRKYHIVDVVYLKVSVLEYPRLHFSLELSDLDCFTREGPWDRPRATASKATEPNTSRLHTDNVQKHFTITISNNKINPKPWESLARFYSVPYCIIASIGLCNATFVVMGSVKSVTLDSFLSPFPRNCWTNQPESFIWVRAEGRENPRSSHYGMEQWKRILGNRWKTEHRQFNQINRRSFGWKSLCFFLGIVESSGTRLCWSRVWSIHVSKRNLS